jgi:DNA-directed RNA polymerase subunit RPC12/RpoP
VADKIHRYPCPGCGAELVFEPRDGALACPHCGRREEIAAGAAQVKAHAWGDYLRTRPERLGRLADGALEIQCAGCGAAVIFTPPTVALRCAFCGADVVAQPRTADPVLAPGALLPFHVTRGQASAAVKQWLASRWLAPSALARMARSDALGGVYLPFWSYDAYTVSHYRGQRGEHYWEEERFTDRDGQVRTRQVQRTQWYPAAGSVTRWFEGVLVAGTRALDPTRLAALEPWDLAHLKPYEPAYLAGFGAQRAQVEVPEAFEHAKPRMAETIAGDVRRAIGGDVQQVDDVATAYSAITFTHVLLPVWVSAYRFEGNVYQLLVNARTGEVQGERPWSVVKLGLVVLLVLALVLLVAVLV